MRSSWTAVLATIGMCVAGAAGAQEKEVLIGGQCDRTGPTQIVEARRFFGPPPKFSSAIEREYLTPWPADTAEQRYLACFAKLARC